jgi:hypothetical protein
MTLRLSIFIPFILLQSSCEGGYIGNDSCLFLRFAQTYWEVISPLGT